jgi:uncharacterized protein YndB with AHSA1/START domain
MTIVRVFNAPRDLVWKAWTDPKRMMHWFGPKGFTTPVCELDVQPGGAQRITMQGPDGTLYPMTAVYEEVNEPERLVWNSSVEHGAGVSFEIRQVATFIERNGKTELRLQASITRATPGSADALGGMEQGWSESLDKLDELLAG